MTKPRLIQDIIAPPASPAQRQEQQRLRHVLTRLKQTFQPRAKAPARRATPPSDEISFDSLFIQDVRRHKK